MIKILGINCSPREKSNSRALLEISFTKTKEKFQNNFEYEIINLKDFNIKPCLACDVCGKTKEKGDFIPCVQKDDMSDVLKKMVESDGIALATPVYFGLPTDLFSKFIMRTRLVRHQDFALSNKVVGIMATAARRSGGAETTILSTWLPFIRNGCIIVGNGDRTCQFGTVAWAGARQHVLTDEWGIEQAIDTVERIYHIANLLKAGAEAIKYQNPMRFCYIAGTRP